MFKTRLAPALEVFQTLQCYPIIRPRTHPDVPIGCTAKASPSMAQTSLQSLYHDLGVLVFAGANVKQTQRIGDILRQVIAWGGLGGTAMRLRWLTTGKGEGYARLGPLSEDSLLKAESQSRKDEIVRIASSALDDVWIDQVRKSQPRLAGANFQEEEAIVSDLPRNGAILPTEVGPRSLPIESYSRLSFDRSSGQNMGEVQLFAVGTGAYVGAATMKYKMARSDGRKSTAEIKTAQEELGRRMELSSQLLNERLDEIRLTVLEPLWELERQIWAHRAEELAV